MKVLKLVLLNSLWLAVLGSLKVGLFTYMLFPETAIASSGAESDGPVGDTTSYDVTESGNAVG
jgi:hypothetical protein